MKILVLTKRQYMGKDLLNDKFGRFWELPLAMAQRGHDVQGIALSYRARPEGRFRPAGDYARLTWHSVNLFAPCIARRHRYFRLAEEMICTFQPDIIWSCSDAYHVILGARLARTSTSKYVIDFYDNFESYPATKVPGVRWMLNRAVALADGVTCVSLPLEKYVRDRYRYAAQILVLENAIRTDLFRPMDRGECRSSLGLPLGAKIIGTAGSLAPTRGIETLYRGFAKLMEEDPNIHLALAGPRPRRSKIPRLSRVHDFGVLPTERVPMFINALDVGVVCNLDSPFGRYNFPQKAREIIACGVAIVGANVGGMNNLLRDHPECLFSPAEPSSLATAVRTQLQYPTKTHKAVPSWSDLGATLETFMRVLRGPA